jgi:hypothetical protein
VSPTLLARLQRVARETARIHMDARRADPADRARIPDYFRPLPLIVGYGHARATMRARGWSTVGYR